MSQDTKVPPKGSDWTRLLTDSDLVSHLGQLLQTYREVSPEQREAALLQAMREIKDGAIKGRETGGSTKVDDGSGAPKDKSNKGRDTGDSTLKPVTVTLPLEVPPAPQVELHHPEPIKDPPIRTRFCRGSIR